MIETLLQAILEQVDLPKKDIEHNLRALLNEAVTKMDLVSKDEIDQNELYNSKFKTHSIEYEMLSKYYAPGTEDDHHAILMSFGVYVIFFFFYLYYIQVVNSPSLFQIRDQVFLPHSKFRSP